MCLSSRLLPALLLLLLGLTLGAERPAQARGGASAPAEGVVPDVGGLHLADARRRLEAAGFRIGRIEEKTPAQVRAIFEGYAWRRLVADGIVTGDRQDYTPAQVQAVFEQHGRPGRGVIDHVCQQSPRPGARARREQLVDLRVCAPQEGLRYGIPSRAGVSPGARPQPASPEPAAPGPDAPEPRAPEPAAPAAAPGAEPAPALPPAATPGRGGPTAPAVPAAAEEEEGPYDGEVYEDEAPLPSGEPAVYAEGSPEAPRIVTEVRTDLVPALLGLALHDAEQLVSEAGMRLYVDRIAGHPIGRVLEQAPSAGGRRPAGGVVRVVVTAGGDFDGHQAPIAPEVVLSKIVVPGLLDRTRLQAIRIVEDLGLRVQAETARRGLPGRVVDQMPPAGGRVPRGGLVRLWFGPETEEGAPAPAAPPPAPGAPVPGPEGGSPDSEPQAAPAAGDPPAPAAPEPAAGAPEAPDVPAPKPPLPPGPLRLGIPEPVSPGHGTALPREASTPIGFTWRGVKGAEAYLLEIEEEGAEGRWMPNARKPAHTTAVILEVERINSRSSGALRWRVTAISNGRAGTPSRWVLLK
jgi:hypothetical protein